LVIVEDAIAGYIALGSELMEFFQEGVEQREILEALGIALGDPGLSSRSGRERVSSAGTVRGFTDVRLGLWLGSGSRTLSSSESFESLGGDLGSSLSRHRAHRAETGRPSHGRRGFGIECAR